ncbi:DUF1963-domain-containing protein [Piromyces finnis]|uniref:DUF1963-domain-containing protein n=1 Tax=Piromyces finnis TaxID=1754191 RepID=A0A1Y1V7R9_9FUNG|nr:DUF1963-domain-containing protein [Piromyces finnis]|eukprot:ORX49336.1 DUF1963-domain-containing protein [Piromyces finnis]
MVDTKKIVENIKRISKTCAYKIKLETEAPTIFDSKFGGLPYWTEGKEYPKNSKGNNLFLLAQINFDKYKFDSPLPSSGMLQFFVDCNDLMGLDFDDQLKQDGFRVIYHDKIDYEIKNESIYEFGVPKNIPEEYEYFPIEKEMKISFNKEMDTIHIGDKAFDKYFTTAYNMNNEKCITIKDNYYKVLSDEEYDKFEEAFNSDSAGHKILGYPSFTQSDPRGMEKYSDYNILLLQIDSEENISWGDAGVCNFFIKEKDLLEKDFSKVLYNWDCF